MLEKQDLNVAEYVDISDIPTVRDAKIIFEKAIKDVYKMKKFEK